jgi:type IV pilus assembly protein PilC
VLGFAIIVVLVMVLFLIPKFAGMFTHSGAQLPMLTRIVVGVSNFMIKYFWALPLFVVLVVVGWLQARKIHKFRFFMDNVLLGLPVFGKEIFFKVFMSRFCRTLGFLLAGGISVSLALEITGQVVSNLPISEAISRVRERVLGGSEISTELRRQRVFSALVGRMASVGERTGRLPELLNRTADYYDSELDHSLSRLTSIIEPFLIVFIGGIVLIVVLALYLPIFNMSKAIR